VEPAAFGKNAATNRGQELDFTDNTIAAAELSRAA
jgi:hypothetical protein